nr:MAG TPA: hypothetical protein [Caudoviricetes sp.]
MDGAGLSPSPYINPPLDFRHNFSARACRGLRGYT